MTFSLSASHPLFPSLLPRAVDPLWLKVDVPKDEDSELTKMEKEYEASMKALTKKTQLPPIGTSSQDPPDDDDEMEEDDDDDNDNDDNEDSDSREEEDDVEMEMNFGQESPVNVLPS